MSEEFKQIDYDELVKNSFMTTIDDERYNLACKVFDKVLGWHPNKHIGCTAYNNVQKNINTSSLNIYKYAKAHDLPYVFLFDDDAYPCVNCIDRLKEYIKIIPIDAKVAMLGYIGIEDFRHQPPLNKKFNKVMTTFYGPHAYITFKNEYDFIINLIEQNLETAHIDWIVTDGKKLNYKCYAVDYPLFIQYNFKTSVTNHHGYVYVNSMSNYYSSNFSNPPIGFKKIEEILK